MYMSRHLKNTGHLLQGGCLHLILWTVHGRSLFSLSEVLRAPDTVNKASESTEQMLNLNWEGRANKAIVFVFIPLLLLYIFIYILKYIYLSKVIYPLLSVYDFPNLILSFKYVDFLSNPSKPSLQNDTGTWGEGVVLYWNNYVIMFN